MTETTTRKQPEDNTAPLQKQTDGLLEKKIKNKCSVIFSYFTVPGWTIWSSAGLSVQLNAYGIWRAKIAVEGICSPKAN